MDEFKIPIGADIAPFLKSLNSVGDELDDVAKKAKNVDEALSDSATSARQIDRAFEQATDNIDKASKSINQTEKNLDKARRSAKDAFDNTRVKNFNRELEKTSKEAQKTNTSIGGLFSLLKKGAGLIGAFFATGIIVDFTRKVIDVTSQFQKMEATLSVALGSRSSAIGAMNMLNDFASKTPFGIQEITESFIKLANRGIVPTYQELEKLGDLASSQGKSLDQLSEAILDAMTGEFERLKEFGIRATKDGNQVQLAFKGISQEVEFSSEAIKNAIIEMGAYEGVAGGMSAVSKTLGGAISNLSDAFDQLMNNIGQYVAPVISSIVRSFADMIGSINDFIGVKEDAMELSLASALQAKNEANANQALLDRYRELKDKGVRATANEKREMERITYALRDAFGDSVMAINKETGALEVNTEATIKAIKQKMILSNQELSNFALQYANLKKTNEEAKKQANYVTEIEKANRDIFKSTNQVTDGMVNQSAIMQQRLAGEQEINSEIIKRREEQAKALVVVEETNKQIEKIANEASKFGVTLDDLDLTKMVEQNKKVEKETSKSQANSSKNTIDLAKERNKILAQLEKELRDNAIKLTEDQYERERKQIEASYQDRLMIAKQQEEEARKVGAINDETQAKFNTNYVMFEKLKNEELKKLDEQRKTDRLALELEIQRELANVNASEYQKSLNDLNANYDDKITAVKAKIEEIKKLGGDDSLYLSILTGLEDERTRKARELGYQKQRDDLQQDLELKKLLIEAYGAEILEAQTGEAVTQLMEANNVKQVDLVKKKAIAIKAVELQSLEDSVKISEAQFGENSTQVQALRAQIQIIKNEISKEIKDSGIDWSDLFRGIEEIGNGDLGRSFERLLNSKFGGESLAQIIGLSPDEQKAIVSSFTSVYNAISNAYIQSVNMQIQEKDRAISALEYQIKKVEDLVKEEEEKQRQGYASNVDAKKRELQELQKQRDQELESRKKLTEEKVKLAKIEIATQTAVATAQMIATGAEVLKNHSGIPFVGVAIGLGLLATMLAGFMAFKNASKQATADVSYFEKGGVIDGKRHTQGGAKYRALDGSNRIVELEGGEYVTNRKSTAKYMPLLEAINNDTLDKLAMSSEGLRLLTEGLGISLDKKALSHNNQPNININVDAKETNYLLSRIAQNTKPNQFRIVSDTDSERIEQNGSITRRIKKHKA